ncbi:GIY-YIG nuclease family protein [Thiothrix lacustris]|uniref:GIY-YIG nuclease family protein n=1 Tax=Thiothrix lacustris TaxID=525917 RepID=A0ABY9MQW1_9GAMM|nr:GIY-YIG nuclease family protein [Thiothrix lacustris]WML91045.1 GIY-YIG nuclease family protein [Thiothrix lacustris]
MPYMYILKCVDDSYYTGSTWNMEKRLAEHQSGMGARHTAKRLPVELVYCEFYDRVDEAFYREKQVQGWSRKKKEALIASDTNALHQLAECKNETHWLQSVGFGYAQPAESTVPRCLNVVEGNTKTGFGYAQPADCLSSSNAGTTRCLSVAEGNKQEEVN